MQRTEASRLAAAAGLCGLVLWGHSAFADPPRFALFLACLAGTALALGRSRATGSPDGFDGARASGTAGTERASGASLAADADVLRRLEAELHSLEDQLRSAERASRPCGDRARG